MKFWKAWRQISSPKIFTEVEKWKHACRLVNIVNPDEFMEELARMAPQSIDGGGNIASIEKESRQLLAKEKSSRHLLAKEESANNKKREIPENR